MWRFPIIPALRATGSNKPSINLFASSGLIFTYFKFIFPSNKCLEDKICNTFEDRHVHLVFIKTKEIAV
jgi:hypothetical protein